MKRKRTILAALVASLAIVLLFAGCNAQPLLGNAAGGGLPANWGGVIAPDSIDSGPAIQAAIAAGHRDLVLLAGHHRILTTPAIPPGTTISGFGATVEVAAAQGFYLQGKGVKLRGMRFIGGNDATLARPTASWGDAPVWLTLDHVDAEIGVATFGDMTLSASRCTFRRPCGIYNATLADCRFEADANLGGTIAMSDCVFDHARFIVGGNMPLHDSLIQRIVFRENRSYINESESICVEGDLLNTIFDDVRFYDCDGLLFGFWGEEGKSMKGCTLRHFQNTGHPSPGLLFYANEAKGGVVDDVTVEGMYLRDCSDPVLIGKGVRRITFRDLYIVELRPSIPGSFELMKLYHDMTDTTQHVAIRIDDPATAKITLNHVRFVGLHGAKRYNITDAAWAAIATDFKSVN